MKVKLLILEGTTTLVPIPVGPSPVGPSPVGPNPVGPTVQSRVTWSNIAKGGPFVPNVFVTLIA